MNVLSSAWWSWASTGSADRIRTKKCLCGRCCTGIFNVLLTDELDINVAVLGGEVQLVGGICILLQGVLAEEEEVLVAGVGDADLAAACGQLKAVRAAAADHGAGDAAVLHLGAADVGRDVFQLEGAAVLDGGGHILGGDAAHGDLAVAGSAAQGGAVEVRHLDAAIVGGEAGGLCRNAVQRDAVVGGADGDGCQRLAGYLQRQGAAAGVLALDEEGSVGLLSLGHGEGAARHREVVELGAFKGVARGVGVIGADVVDVGGLQNDRSAAVLHHDGVDAGRCVIAGAVSGHRCRRAAEERSRRDSCQKSEKKLFHKENLLSQ